jgi:hypothetical protein
MELNNKVCIINVGVDYWYTKGTKRLRESLEENGWKGAMLIDTDYPANSPSHETNPYAFKVYQVEKALSLGYTKIFWMDCSIISSPNPNWVTDIMDTHFAYFIKNGASVGQETNDKTLEHFNITRDKAMELPQVCSGFFGLDFNHPLAREIFAKWKGACEKGCFRGKRTHSLRDSLDPRFLYHRQDQSSLSLAIYTTLENPVTCIYNMEHGLTYDFNKQDRQEFLCWGM